MPAGLQGSTGLSLQARAVISCLCLLTANQPPQCRRPPVQGQVQERGRSTLDAQRCCYLTGPPDFVKPHWGALCFREL